MSKLYWCRMMGNLARAAFPASTKAVWPWSYDSCDKGSVRDLDHRQEINACIDDPGHGMHPHQGRGAPEIDLFEVNSFLEHKGHVGDSPAYMSTSYQVSPGVSEPNKRPVNGHRLNDSYTWYEHIQINDKGEINSGFWGQEVCYCAESVTILYLIIMSHRSNPCHPPSAPLSTTNLTPTKPTSTGRTQCLLTLVYKTSTFSLITSTA